ncbi:ABC transporter permease subunit [Bacillus sp. DHT2]|uniref:ABC transporter permease subunit n=1 Tax=Bacillus sp. DHT2 TaxID=2994532 RepID=UPI002248D046|nr:ABC transporter permease subunit [Bacillus sp. DHT2]MCX2829057.1 ABC transporter permease subunit [Bacillus sp. DHT2]
MVFAKKLSFFIVRLLFIVLGIICICCLPKLLLTESQKGMTGVDIKTSPLLQLNWDQYIESIKNVIHSLVHLSQVTYELNGIDRELFPYLLEPYLYTLTILTASLFIAIVLSTFLTNFTFYFSKQVQSLILKVLNVLETLPDLFFVISVQLIIILIYKNTNWLVIIPFSTIQGKTYFLPIITLSILPTIYLYRMNLLNYKTELTKDYIDFAIAKGLKPFYILYRHVFINVIISTFYNAKAIFIFMISNMIVLEFLFNSFGLLKFLINHQTSEITSIGILLLMIPFYLSFEISRWILSGRRNTYV